MPIETWEIKDRALQYLEWLRANQYAPTTVRTRTVHVSGFVSWCDYTGLKALKEVTAPVLLRYQSSLLAHRKRDGVPLCVSTIASQMITVRSLLRWHSKQAVVADPTTDLTLPKVGYRLPRVLTQSEVERVLVLPSVRIATGLRDRAIIETLYSSGLRRTELIRLQMHELDWNKGLLTIRQGKGNRDRVVPIGDRALDWIKRYCAESRHLLVEDSDEQTLFLTLTGRPFSPNHLSGLVRRYVHLAHPFVAGACHIFRHTMATLMLEGGADIRYIQQMLGHSKLSSTQIYTHVSIRALKQVHTRTHPAAVLRADRVTTASEVETIHWAGT